MTSANRIFSNIPNTFEFSIDRDDSHFVTWWFGEVFGRTRPLSPDERDHGRSYFYNLGNDYSHEELRRNALLLYMLSIQLDPDSEYAASGYKNAGTTCRCLGYFRFAEWLYERARDVSDDPEFEALIQKAQSKSMDGTFLDHPVESELELPLEAEQALPFTRKLARIASVLFTELFIKKG